MTTQPVLALWEYLVTFTNEVDIFWRKPKTTTSLLIVVTRWTMVASALLEFAPMTETTLDSIPFSHMSDINLFLSDCDAFTWVVYALSYAGYIETACKQAHFIMVTSRYVLNSST